MARGRGRSGGSRRRAKGRRVTQSGASERKRGGWPRRLRQRGPGRARSWRRRLLRALVLVLLAFGLATALPVACLRVVDPPTSSVIVQHRLRAWSQDAPAVEHRPVPMEAISPHLAVAVLAAEDQRFPQHAGVDPRAIRTALEERVEGGRLRGASTLTQQVAKNLFLWPERSWLRKALEAWLALAIDALWPKRRILEVHLNVAQMGPHTYGAQAASLRHFGKPALALTPREAALLAAVLPNPEVLRLDPPSAYVRERAAHIQAQMRQLGGPAFLDRLD